MKTKIMLILTAILLSGASLDLSACYAVIAGKNTTFDGSILVAHAEQNSGGVEPQGHLFVNFRVVPRVKHQAGDYFLSQFGAKIPSNAEDYSFIWSEVYGSQSSDGIFNEWGVVCVSDMTQTLEDSKDELTKNGDINEGGLTLEIRLEVARKAKSARDAVRIIGQLVEKYGYGQSGTTHVLADANEAWLVNVVFGKRWVAQRVPDDEVVVLANVVMINEVDLKDTNNFRSSPDLIDYAVKRGWYDQQSGKPFNFKDVYQKRYNTDFIDAFHCDPRQWRGQCYITGKNIELPVTENLPFSVKPNRKIGILDLKQILSDHLEGCQFDSSSNPYFNSPHDFYTREMGGICCREFQEVCVFQLRNWLPKEIGNVYWRGSSAGCSSVLIPWYLGIYQTPSIYSRHTDSLESMTMKFHFRPHEETLNYSLDKAFYVYNELENLIDYDYQTLHPPVAQVWKQNELNTLAVQPEMEEMFLKLYKKDKELCRRALTDYSGGIAWKYFDMAKIMIEDIKNERFGY